MDNEKVSSIWDQAKWWVPSVGALFILFGYVSETAHQSLLGIELGIAASNDYIVLGGRLLTDVLTNLVEFILGNLGFESFFRDQPTSIWWWCMILLGSIGLSLGIYVYPLLASVIRRGRPYTVKGTRLGDLAALRISFVALALLGTILGKVVIMDLPMTRVSDLLVQPGASAPGKFEENSTNGGQGVIDKLLSPTADQGGIAGRAYSLLNTLICSRVVQDGSIGVPYNKSAPTLGEKLSCRGNTEENAKFIERLFVQEIILTLAIVALAAFVLKLSKRTGLHALAVFGAIYALLSLSYAHGKLIHPTYYSWGQIVFKSVVVPVDLGQKDEDRTNQQPSNRSGTSSLLGREQPGFFLAFGGTTAKLLVSGKVNCPTDAVSGGGVSSTQQWRFWQVATSEIAAIREIEQREIIGEYLKLKLELCHASRRPPQF